MPITTKASYIPCTTLFLENWEAVNLALGSGVLTIPGMVLGWSQAILRSDLDALLTDLVAARNLVATANFELAEKRDDFDSARANVVDKHGQLNAVIRGSLPGTKWERLITPVPNADAGHDIVLGAATAGLALWTKIDTANVLGAPLVIRDGVTAAGFQAARDAVTTTANTRTEAEQDLREAREARNDIEDRIYAVLKAYRQLLPQKFPPGHALVESMPTLTPPPGATPDAVEAVGVFDVPTLSAVYTWTASETAEVSHYDVLGLAGDAWEEDDADLLGTVQADEPRTFSTAQFLSAPGAKLTVKIYARTPTGHTAGSNAVTVQRPV